MDGQPPLDFVPGLRLSGGMLVTCGAYRDGRKIAEPGMLEISQWLAEPDTFVWVALKDPEPGELAWMQEEFELHPLAIEDAQQGHERAKVEEYGDALFVALNTLEATPEGIVAGELDVFVGPRYVLSVRHRTREGYAAVRQRCEREPELLRQGPGFVLYALMDAVVDRYFPVVEALERELERLEGRIFAGAPARSTVEALYALKQQLTDVQHAVRPLLDATAKLFGGRVPPVCVHTQEYFRDVFDHLLRIQQSLDALRDTLNTAVSVNLSLISLQENETTKKLAGWAALIAVPTLIAGLWGMNFQHMPELGWRFGYPLALGIMGSVDLYLWWLFKRSGWL